MNKNLKFGIHNLLKDDFKDQNMNIAGSQCKDQRGNNWMNKYKEIYNYYTMSNYKRRMSVCSIFPATRCSSYVGRPFIDKKKIPNIPNDQTVIDSLTEKISHFYGPQFSMASLETLSKIWLNKNCLIACYQEMQNKPRKTMLRRSVFSDSQRKGLEIAFKKHPYITKPDRKELAEELCLKDSQVKIWFQNRRMKWRNNRTIENK